MTRAAILVPAGGSASATQDAACLHCGGFVAHGERFCCSGCAGAWQLVRELGLSAYYGQRLDRVDPPSADPWPADPTPFVRTAGEVCTLDLAVDGLHCAACIWLIESALGRDPDVVQVRLNVTDRRLHLAWRGSASRGADFADVIRRLGYRVAPFVAGAAARLADDEQRLLLRCLAVAGFAAANVMILSVSVWAGLWTGQDGMGTATRDLMHWISAMIALPALIYAARPFLRSALGALAHGRSNMDVPIVIGVTLTAAVSLAETIQSGERAYFESALMLVFFLLVGRYVERRVRGRARSAASHLLSLAGSVATVERADGGVRYASAGQIALGDVLRVATGERLVADGTLLSHETRIDNSVVTGESLPLPVSAGTVVHAGAINLGAPVRVAVTTVGEDTLLARVARLLEAAEHGRSRYLAMADRVARWYAPSIHALAACTFALWYFVADAGARDAILAAASVLIVTCPCALALAAPSVATAAVGRLARAGVLVTSPTALERLGEIDTVVFDKTGTLTRGRPTLIDDPARNDADLSLAASIAMSSRHPLARALVAAAPSVPAANGVVEHPGEGLALGDVRFGSRRFCGVAATMDDELAEIWLTRPGAAPVRFTFIDALKPDARTTIRQLRVRGLRVLLLSGDRTTPVANAAAQCDITEWHAGLATDQKLAFVRKLGAEGRRVLMIGDGINDAPALAAAHASLSPGDATDIATAAADALFRGESLASVVEVLDLAQGARRALRTNLLLALGYNLVAVPIAVAGWLTPAIAALAMSGSSLLVVLNAARIGRQPRRSAGG